MLRPESTLKLLKSTKFPPEFNQKVDMQKMNLAVMKKLVRVSYQARPIHTASSADLILNTPIHRWIASKVTEILGSEDDVVIELVFNLIEGARYVVPQHRSDARSPWISSIADAVFPARYQGSSNTTYRVSRQRYGAILQGALEAISQRPSQPLKASRRSSSRPRNWNFCRKRYHSGSLSTAPLCSMKTG